MSAMTNDDLPMGDELLSKILKSCRSILPMMSYRDVAPGEVMTVEVRSNCAEFPEKTCFAPATSGCFEVDEVALRPWRRAPLVLQSRDRGDRTNLASVDELLRRIIVPTNVDLVLTVRNLGSAPQKFVCGVVSYSLPPEETARRIEAVLARCADGSPRRDLRVALGLEDPFTRIRHVPSLARLPPGFGWDPYPDT